MSTVHPMPGPIRQTFWRGDVNSNHNRLWNTLLVSCQQDLVEAESGLRNVHHHPHYYIATTLLEVSMMCACVVLATEVHTHIHMCIAPADDTSTPIAESYGRCHAQSKVPTHFRTVQVIKPSLQESWRIGMEARVV